MLLFLIAFLHDHTHIFRDFHLHSTPLLCRYSFLIYEYHKDGRYWDDWLISCCLFHFLNSPKSLNLWYSQEKWSLSQGKDSDEDRRRGLSNHKNLFQGCGSCSGCNCRSVWSLRPRGRSNALEIYQSFLLWKMRNFIVFPEN